MVYEVLERNQTLKMRTLIHSIGDSNFETIHMLSLDNSVAIGSGILRKIIECHRQKAVLVLEEGKASRLHKEGKVSVREQIFVGPHFERSWNQKRTHSLPPRISDPEGTLQPI